MRGYTVSHCGGVPRGVPPFLVLVKVKSAHIGFCCVYVHPCCQVGNVGLSCYKVKDRTSVIQVFTSV